MKQVAFLFLIACFVSTSAAFGQGYSMNGALPYYRSQNWNALLDYSKRWSNAEPNNGRPWFCLGEAAYHSGDYETAVEGFGKATKLMPNEPKPWNNLSAAYCKLQQWNLASKAVTDGEAASKGMCTATDWYVFGNARKDLKDYEGAMADYKRALSMRPNFPEATNNMGVCQYALGNTAAASANYNQSARQGNTVAKNNQAGIAAEQQAAQNLQQVQSDPNNVWNWSRKSLNAKMQEENSRRDINGNYRERQY
jgi:tetratricopeptide (TPR) repeat protein